VAAEKLFVTQPLISTKVKQLESSYKTRLFERFGRKIEMTHAGNILFEYADRIFNIVKEADTHMEDMKGIGFGNLRISAGLTLGTYYLPPLLSAFTKNYPNIEIHMKVKNKKEVMEDILSFKDDLGFVGYMESNEKLVITPLWEEELVLIVSSSHEFAKRKTISLSKLNGQPFILREKGSGTRELVEEKLNKKRISVKVVMELESHEAIMRAVEAALGICIIPTCAIKREAERGLFKVIRLTQERIFLKYYMIYHKDKYLSTIIQEFIKMALELSDHQSDGKD
jgi:DNA-binding transcriptional LysR family regulator